MRNLDQPTINPVEQPPAHAEHGTQDRIWRTETMNPKTMKPVTIEVQYSEEGKAEKMFIYDDKGQIIEYTDVIGMDILRGQEDPNVFREKALWLLEHAGDKPKRKGVGPLQL